LKNYLRNAIRLGTSLTALFLLVRCGVPARDYSKLGIGQNAGGSGNDVLHSSGGQAGLDGLAGSDQGGTGGAPPAPIPCTYSSNPPTPADAGSTDAGSTDAGITDAGTGDASGESTAPDNSACACVDGFIKAVDADGDGIGSRACSIAPGLDCDDGDPAVTHNACGGCTVLPNAVGEDCGDCGTYACDGPDSLECVSKPGPVEDPDCRCVSGLIIARDTDGDGAGTRLCEQNPGADCNDGDGSVITNECGGCADLSAAVGDACNECGAYVCYNNGTLGPGSNGTLRCQAKTGAAGQQCLPDGKTRQTCINEGVWDTGTLCDTPCRYGACAKCTPGTFYCGAPYLGSTILYKCLESTSSFAISWWSWASCSATQTCNATSGTCLGTLFLPRDRTFDVVPSQRDGLPWHDILNTASDSDYG
jgi:hypothetical protein